MNSLATELYESQITAVPPQKSRKNKWEERSMSQVKTKRVYCPRPQTHHRKIRDFFNVPDESPREAGFVLYATTCSDDLVSCSP
ncbi:hypothetical protein PROFUN_13520 [Planoprotostelium fungivorum]|uniref:Uncharacterized protein n=1 Tax=Planoprotostelium fungivorum TaxID=1890364 RepID=A0A2P6N3J4_9EUKA|nr:hypothetical protein PROFUN_13520 [Planoprotostelium fungivorum]